MRWLALFSLLFLAEAEGGDKNVFEFETDGRMVRVWTYAPKEAGPSAPVVVVMHGVKRNGEDYRENWIRHSDERGFVVLVPEFSNKDWPGSRCYNSGNVLGKNGRETGEESWAFTAIDLAFDEYLRRSGNRSKNYHLFGHSAGGQFVHRLVLMRPKAKFSAAITANAGWYTMPDFDEAWPYGLKGVPVNEAQLTEAFARRLTILMGEKDNDPEHRYLRRTPEAMKQGPHRLARGKKFYDAAVRRAEDMSVSLGWKRKTVPGVGHDNLEMVPAAVQVFFVKGE